MQGALRFALIPHRLALAAPAMEQLEQQQAETLGAIADAATPEAVEAIRVAALGKQGWVSALLKTLGGMSPEQRQSEGPKIHAAREAVTAALAARKGALEAAALDARLAAETVDLSLPAPEAPRGSVHPVSQVMDELAEIFADMGFAVASGPRSRTTGTTSPRSTCPKRIRRGRCTIPSISRTRMRKGAPCCCARIPRRCRSARC
jgi:phenylalanyl-tRNA synthetase alpha chain